MSGFIPQAFIDDLSNRADIVDVVNSRVQLKKAGKNYSACCPFHHEKTPSFIVSPDKQFYHCFGCGASGSVLTFIMEYDHLDFPQAVEELAKQLGLDVPYENRSGIGHGYKKEAVDSPLYSYLAKAAAFYQQALKDHPTKQAAVNYLKNRGLTGAIAKAFSIGFAPPGWDNLIKHFNADDSQQKQLIDAGLVIENADNGRRYDRFRDRVIFPIRDMKGRIIAFGGRVLGDDKPKYLNSPETAVFHKSEVLYGLYEVRKNSRQLDEIWVLEGYMDVIALSQFGFTNVVATLGTATSEEHIKRLFRMVTNILFCFDGDAAGRKAAWRALESALPYLQDGRRVKFLFLPEGEDPDSLVRQEGVDALKARASHQALSLTDYFFEHLIQEAKPDTLEGKAHLASLANVLLAKMPRSGVQTLMYQRLKELTGLDQAPIVKQSLVKEISIPYTPHMGKPNIPSDLVKNTAYPAKNRIITPAMRVLRYLLHYPYLIKMIDKSTELQAIDDYETLLVKVITLLQKEPNLNSFQLMGKLVGDDHEKLLTQLMDKERLINDQNNLEKEFIDTILMLTKQQNDRKLDELLQKGSLLTEDEKDQLRTLLAAKAKG